MFFFSKAREVVWGKPAETRAERRLIVKLDVFILSFCCLMYWVNYLDRMNLNNAYVSGMKDDLGFEGNQLNVINTSEHRHPIPLISASRGLTENTTKSSTAATLLVKFPTTLPCKNSHLVSGFLAAWLAGGF